eukprot:COSAG05_NODE_1044_length_6057_cov_9.395267_1_plen_279_part_00
MTPVSVDQDALGVPGQRILGTDLAGCGSGSHSTPAALQGEHGGGSDGGGSDDDDATMTSSKAKVPACTNVWTKPLLGDGDPGSAASLVFLNAGETDGVDILCDAACWAAAGFPAAHFPLYVTDLWNTSTATLLQTPEWTARNLSANGGFQMLQANRPPAVERLPHLQIPHCVDGAAMAKDFKNDRSPPGPKQQLANQSTEVAVCWDAQGLIFHTNASDVNIFNTATGCNDPVFSTGDVLEVFIAPVDKLTDTPAWYLELDTASSGALWGMLGHNPLNR